MKLVRLILIALLSLSVPMLGLAGAGAVSPCCMAHSGQQQAAADEQDHCAKMRDAQAQTKANGGCDSQSHGACKADGKCGASNPAPSVAVHISSVPAPVATSVAVFPATLTPLSRDPDGLWHPPRII